MWHMNGHYLIGELKLITNKFNNTHDILYTVGVDIEKLE